MLRKRSALDPLLSNLSLECLEGHTSTLEYVFNSTKIEVMKLSGKTVKVLISYGKSVPR